MKPSASRRLAALLLALILTVGIAPVVSAATTPTAPSAPFAGSVSYRDYAGSDPYYASDLWGEEYFLQGDSYTSSRDYWAGSFYYRDNYYWGPDNYVTDPQKRGNALFFTSPNVNHDGSVNAAAALRQIGYAARESTDAYAMLRIINGEMMTNAAMQGLGGEARGNGKIALVCAYTMLPGQTQHQTRLYFEPEQFLASGRDVRLGVYSDNEWLYETKQQYLDQFTNYVELIRFGQRDEFPAAVQVYAQIDLSKLNKDNLRFYSVNRDTGSVTELKDPKYSFAANGKLTFHTKLAGDILIADRELIQKIPSNGWISDERIAAEQPQAIADAAVAAAKKAADLAAQAAATANAAAGTDQAKAKQDAAKAAQKAADDAKKAADQAVAAAAAIAAAQ